MVFQLLVSGGGWDLASDSIVKERVFEHTEDDLALAFDVETETGCQRIMETPALLMPEVGQEPALAKVARINRVRVQRGLVKIDYAYDAAVAPIPLKRIRELRPQLRIDDWEFGRTHWAVKEVDLFRTLMLENVKPALSPKVFKIDDVDLDDDLVAVMMPFDTSLGDVFKSIKAAAKTAGYKCKRADDIWEDSILIQDVVTLINRSSVVVCDCSGRNANVFYEAGIAHSLGREVVLITQTKSDVPFDLQHHRFVLYLNNIEGRAALEEKLAKRLATLKERATRAS